MNDRWEAQDKVEAVSNSGADELLTKPFD